MNFLHGGVAGSEIRRSDWLKINCPWGCKSLRRYHFFPIFIDMRLLILLSTLFIGILSSYGQTNVINIFNSQVTINNIVPTADPTNSIKKTNMVVLPQYFIERLRWEDMMEQRRRSAFNSYLRKYRNWYLYQYLYFNISSRFIFCLRIERWDIFI